MSTVYVTGGLLILLPVVAFILQVWCHDRNSRAAKIVSKVLSIGLFCFFGILVLVCAFFFIKDELLHLTGGIS